jgi:sulfonate transport system permease protein
VRAARRRIPALLTEIWLPVLIVVIVWFVSAQSTAPFYPPLESILVRFGELWFSARFVTDVLPSVGNLLAGYAVAVAVGVVVGLVLGRFDRLRLAVTPQLEFLRCLPSIALVPLVLVGFGIGDDAKIIVIAFGAVWPILLATIDGSRSVDPVLRDVAATARLSGPATFLRVVLPSAAPGILAGARVSLSIAVVLVVVSELAGADRGIGYVLLSSQRRFAMTDMWAAMVLFGILGYALNVVFRIFERKVISWHPAHRDA